MPPLATIFRALRVRSGLQATFPFRWTAGSVRVFGMGSHVSDNDPVTLAREKAKSLEGHTPTIVPGAPGWNEKLASDSEAVVKAERAAARPGAPPGAAAAPGEDVSADVQVLVRHTVEVLREEAFIDRVVDETRPPAESEDPLTRGSSPL